jgi:hypothetical protein
MALGKLPGRLAKGAGSLVREFTNEFATGGYSAPPQGAHGYTPVDARREYWRGIGEDMSNVIMGQPYQNMSHRRADTADEMNMKGPAMFLQQRLRQAQAQQKMQQIQAQQQDYQRYVQASRQADVYQAQMMAQAKAAPGTFQGTGLEAQMLNKYLANQGNPEWLSSPEGQMVTQFLQRARTTTTPEGTTVTPGYTLSGTETPTAAPTPEKFIPKPPTQGERTAQTFIDRMSAAEANLEGVEDVLAAPVEIARGVTNVTASAEYRQAEQAKSMWIEAYLRKDSGAQIGPDEYKNADETFFPQAGDSAEDIERKRQSRQDAMASLRVQAGRAGESQEASDAQRLEQLKEKYGI